MELVGIQPPGNALLDAASGTPLDTTRRALGALCVFDDDVLLECVLPWLDGSALSRFGAASRATYAYAAHADLWKSLTLSSHGSDWVWEGSWRSTLIACEAAACEAAARGSAPREAAARGAALTCEAPAGPSTACELGVPPETASRFASSLLALRAPRVVRARGLYSTPLFQTLRCAGAAVDPAWLAHDTLPRVDARALSSAEFEARFVRAGTPAVLTGAVEGGWPGWRAGAWSSAALARTHGATRFHCAGYEVPLARYCAYARALSGESGGDDQALLLFDKDFAAKAPALGGYSPPACFGQDLFATLGDTAGARPDWRWLIVGPARSGSVFHQDPNGTSAWNACLEGRKKWVLLPPDMAPPGVWPAADGSHVCTTMSAMEWFLEFYEHFAAARNARVRTCAEAAAAGGSIGSATSGGNGGDDGVRSAHTAPPKRARTSGWGAPASAPIGAPLQQPFEGVCEAGECVFVPAGWWHCVLNLEPTVAVTHNFCPPSGLARVLRFLRDKPYAVSGLRGDDDAPALLRRFRAALEAHAPADLARADAELAGEAAADAAAGGDAAVAHAAHGAGGRWARIAADAAAPFSLSAGWA